MRTSPSDTTVVGESIMRGTGPVRLNGTMLYGYFTEGAGVVRLRLSVDEWDQLNLSEGQRVQLSLPDREPAHLLILATARTPPFVWMDLRAAARTAG
jgi:hypothetical protein